MSRFTLGCFTVVILASMAEGCAPDAPATSSAEEALVNGVLDTSFGTNGFASVSFEGAPGGGDASGEVKVNRTR